MAGHSHWSSIKHKKEITDKKRGQIFSKLAREIEVAARQGGDPDFNPKLRVAIEKAKKMKMPTENIEKAIKRGTGELKGERLEEFVFEALGPGGVAIIIEGISDNIKRSLNKIKEVLKNYGGKLVGEGGVRWQFERRGCIVVNQKLKIKNQKDKENLEMLAIEAGAEDLYWHGDVLDVYTKMEDLEKVKKNLEEKGVEIESTSLDWVAKEEIEVDENTFQQCQKLFSALDDLDSVQEIYSNLKTF